MPRQLQLFRMPAPSSKQLRELVRSRLHGFKLRQAAREARRIARNRGKAKGASS